MNFKLTKYKTFSSISIYAITSYLLFRYFSGIDVCEEVVGEKCGCPTAWQFMFPVGFLISIIPLGITYIIWSSRTKRSGSHNTSCANFKGKKWILAILWV